MEPNRDLHNVVIHCGTLEEAEALADYFDSIKILDTSRIPEFWHNLGEDACFVLNIFERWWKCASMKEYMSHGREVVEFKDLFTDVQTEKTLPQMTAEEIMSFFDI